MGAYAGRTPGELVAIEIRPLVNDDIGYVFETWGRSLRPCYRDIEGKDYLDGLRAHLQVLLGGQKPRVALVATPPQTPSVIVGWLVGEPPSHIDYVYTRAEYRQAKVARRLVEAAGFDLGMLETGSRTSAVATAIARTHGIRLRAVF